MSVIAEMAGLGFALDPEHEAHEPPEARGLRRDEVRLLVSRGRDDPVDARFAGIGAYLCAGDLLVVNTSATIPAALDGLLPGGEPVAVHLSGEMPGGFWLVEVRRPHDGTTLPMHLDAAVGVDLLGGGHIRLLDRFAGSQRLWIARTEVGDCVTCYAAEHGRPIRYRYVPADWPLEYYRTIFAVTPGSAEMPSASRPFTPEVVTDLVSHGVLIAPLLLHAGVSSLEGGERPYPERYEIPTATAATINAVRRDGGRVIAAGTTVVRALATVTDEHGAVHPGRGWTDLVVTGGDRPSSIDGLLTGWHEPESSHLMMLQAFADRAVLGAAYRSAFERGYLWHEFGDSHLILRESA